MIKKELEELLTEIGYNEEEIKGTLEKEFSSNLSGCSKVKLNNNIQILLENGVDRDKVLKSISSIAMGAKGNIEETIRVLKKYKLEKEDS